MPTVTFFPQRKSVNVKRGVSILDAAKSAGIKIETPCNGAGTCGKCKTKIAYRWRKGICKKANKFHDQDFDEDIFLACQSLIQDEVELETVASESKDNLKILSEGKSIQVELDPWVKKESTGDETTISANGIVLRRFHKPVLPVACLGVSVDIGTTTLVTALIDLETGRELAVSSSLNPQALLGQDVLSRIKLGGTEEGLAKLHGELIQELNLLFQKNARKSNTTSEDIYEVIFSGNTTMLYLGVKENPSTLGKFPYNLTLRGDCHVKAADIGLKIAENGIVYLPPVISAYVGADITSGILSTRLESLKGVSLFIDIGTNGEMALAVDGKLSATSTAAGPAFEGMNISCGMRAAKGAIEVVNLDNDGVSVKTIADAPAVGICGSGLIDAIGELAAHEVIDRNGRFTKNPETLPPQWRDHLIQVEGKPAFRLSGEVYLSQKDVRHVQLAKGAVRAGVELMLKTQGISPEQVDRVLIAGSFGYHLRTKSLVNIGLLPRAFGDKIEFVGNTSKTGGGAFLLNRTTRTDMSSLVSKVEVVELANHPDFEKTFVQMMLFPRK